MCSHVVPPIGVVDASPSQDGVTVVLLAAVTPRYAVTPPYVPRHKRAAKGTDLTTGRRRGIMGGGRGIDTRSIDREFNGQDR